MKFQKHIAVLGFIGLLAISAFAADVKVTTKEDLYKAVKASKPGDTITMANNTWFDVELNFNAHGEPNNPIVLRAETAGKVILRGTSRIMISGTYLVVEGLWFNRGNTQGKPVITFKKNPETVAKYCRVTNCAITDYNPSDRAEGYNWVELWGKNNRVDHNSFYGKTNQGPVLIVGLKGNEENYNNNHRIDNNYFGYRPALGSNGGETIRVGTSHVSMESSRTIIEENLFEKCNGEVEIISNKTCDNIIRNNLFVESEGVLTLRHGNRCLVEGNVFFGNNKPHTGGIRVINEGHIVQNNLMVGLTGDGFRAPLVLMNGVPNGPANRYNQVKDVTIQNNTFIDCSAVELCDGSDAERTAVPENTIIANNLFYSSKPLSLLTVSDDISGINFSGNKYQGDIKVNQAGFERVNIAWENLDMYPIPSLEADSLLEVSKTSRPLRTDLTGAVRTKLRAGAITPGNKKVPVALTIQPGVSWPLEKATPEHQGKPKEAYKIVEVEPGENTLLQAVKKAKDFTILKLKAGEYPISRGLQIDCNLIIEGAGSGRTKVFIDPKTESSASFFFRITEGNTFTLKALELDGSTAKTLRYGVISQKTPTAKSYRFIMDDVHVHDLYDEGSSFFKAYKGTFADSIKITNSKIEKMFRGLNLSYEKDDIGKYNAEVVDIKNTVFKDIDQFAINYYRGGNDESTLGGRLNIDHCVFYNIFNDEKGRALRTNGIVYVSIANSIFAESPYSQYSAILKGVNNTVSNSIVFNSGELKTSSKAKSSNIKSLNPKWENTETFQLKSNSDLKNAATDGTDIGIMN